MQTDAVIVGGGAAGFFAAIQCKAARPDAQVIILEKSRKLLAKVRISGGGRCNVTHACFDPRQLITHYPRGHRELLGPFHRWNPTHTVDWFAERGVPLKTESDGRMFPTTDSSQTIIDALLNEARALGVDIRTECGLVAVEATDGGFALTCTNGDRLDTRSLLLATGGLHASIGMKTAAALGHTIVPPVPSLFTFNIKHPLLKDLPGLSVTPVVARVEGCKQLVQEGPLLITHWGLSGPAILKLSAWGARELAECAYDFAVVINWLGHQSPEETASQIVSFRTARSKQAIHNKSPFPPIPRRLWERMVDLAGIAPGTPWSQLTKPAAQALVDGLTRSRLPVTGKSTNKEEFVTSGGVQLNEIDMKTFESRKHPGLFLAGEMIDVDGVTGGFNFQAAWTGGTLAGQAMAER